MIYGPVDAPFADQKCHNVVRNSSAEVIMRTVLILMSVLLVGSCAPAPSPDSRIDEVIDRLRFNAKYVE
jgi:hypothetical protein